MAREKSFADKVKKTKGDEKQHTTVKYVKSVVSEKTGRYRFQDKMIKVPVGKSVQSFVDEMEKGTPPPEEPETETDSTPEEEETVKVAEGTESEPEGKEEAQGEEAKAEKEQKKETEEEREEG